MLYRGIKALAGTLIGLLAAGAIVLVSSKPRGDPIQLKPPPTLEPLRIHVTGAVHTQGVYQLPRGSIVEDALEIAGGALPASDLTSINLAAPLFDGQQVFVPGPGDPDGSPSSRSSISNTSALGLVHVNTATVAELQLLPGIGPVLAQKIVEYREAHGPYARPDDLLSVSGIGPSTLETIRDLIRVP